MLMEKQKYLKGQPVPNGPVLAAVDLDWCRENLSSDTHIWAHPIADLKALREVFDRVEGGCEVRIYIPEPVAWMTSRIASGMAPLSAESTWCQMAEMALGLAVDQRVELALLGRSNANRAGPVAWVDLVARMICRTEAVARLQERITIVSVGPHSRSMDDQIDMLWSKLTATNPFQTVPSIDLQTYQLRIDRLEQAGRTPASHTLMHERLTALQQLAEDSHRHALEQQKEVEALRASTSWRITSPLRRLTGMLRNLRR